MKRRIGVLGSLLPLMAGLFGTSPDPLGPVVVKGTMELEPELPPEPRDPQEALAQLNEYWHPFEMLNFDDTTVTRWAIDTRDFHWRSGKDLDFMKDLDQHKLRRRKQAYLHTASEAAKVFSRYYVEHHVQGRAWRYLRLKDIFRARQGQCKYMFVYRLPEGLVITSQENFIFHRADLAAPIL